MQKSKVVWVILRSHVTQLPPIMTVLQCLLEDHNHEVRFVSTQSCSLKAKNFREYVLPQYHNVSSFQKIKNYIGYRKFVKKIFDKHLKNDDLIWIGSLDTALACKGMSFFESNQYILQLHELYDTHHKKLKSIKMIAQNAKSVVVPEINRAGILQVWLRLKRRPVVIPNKPYYHPRQRRMTPTNDITKDILEKFKTERPIILYQGHIGSDRNLLPIAEAMQDLPEYEFWLLGTDHGYADQLLKVSDNIKYLGSVPAPLHLEITSYASIGVMSYDLINLNNLYCAPNKVWEYSGFGIPFLANECLSLEHLVKYKIGLISKWNTDGIKNNIKILMGYSFAHDIQNYFDSYNLLTKINELLE